MLQRAAALLAAAAALARSSAQSDSQCGNATAPLVAGKRNVLRVPRARARARAHVHTRPARAPPLHASCSAPRARTARHAPAASRPTASRARANLAASSLGYCTRRNCR